MKDTTAGRLATSHARQLEESGVDLGIARERGYESVRSRSELLDFKKYQRRAPALLVPLYSPDGVTTSAQIRPDNPRRDKKGRPIKYETRGDSEIILDVHPRMREEARAGDADLWITEGIKKEDSLASRDLPTVGLIGVWCWQRDGEMLPCWDHVRLAGRRVYVVFDADVMEKPNVQLALERFVAALEERGAEVLVVYLPGPEKGVDDFLAAGHTVNELKALARRFEASDIGKIRVSKDARLRSAVEDLWRAWWAFDWIRLVGTGERPNSMRGHSCRDVMKVLIDAAARHGKVTGDGVRVSMARRTLALRAATSKPTVDKAVRHLEAEGLLSFESNPQPEKPGTFVLRANLTQVGGEAPKEKVTLSLLTSHPGGKGLRAPRLRWSAPTFERDGDEVVRGYIRRLGKIAGAIVDALDAGGEMDVSELAAALNRRSRDLRRRNFPRLTEAGIVDVSGDVVCLTPNWREALERAREIAGEIAAEKRDRSRYRLQSEAFRRRRETQADRAPTEEEMARDPRREEREKRRRIDVLVAQGMGRRFAVRQILKVDGFVEELERVGGDDPPPKGPPPRRRLPHKGRDGVHHHGPECSCWLCDEEALVA